MGPRAGLGRCCKPEYPTGTRQGRRSVWQVGCEKSLFFVCASLEAVSNKAIFSYYDQESVAIGVVRL